VTAVWIRFGAELRSRLATWLALALAAGIACGLVVALAAASQRTATAYPRFIAATNSADAYVDPGYAFGGDESLEFDRIERLPQVAAAEQTAILAVIARSRTGHALYTAGPGAVQFNVPMDGRPRDTIDRQKLLRGRFPDPRRSDEVLLDSKAARAFDADVGDVLRFRVLSHHTVWHERYVLFADPLTARGGPLVSERVVGVSANARSDIDAGIVHLTSGFYRAHGGRALGAWLLELETRLKHRGDLKAFEAGVQRIAGKRPYGFFEPTEGRTQIQRSVALLARALRILTVLGGLAALLLIGQALLRDAVVVGGAQPVLRALGLTRGPLLALAVLRTLVVAVPATAIAVLVAAAASPLTPIGWARELEPDPGFAFDARIIGIGAAATFAALVVTGVAAGAWALRGAPAGEARAPGSPPEMLRTLRPAAAAGVRMALLRGPGLPVRSTLAAAVLAVTVAATALTFAGSLQHLLDTPRLYGRTWDFEMAGGGPPFDSRSVASLVRDPGLAGVAVGAVGPLEVGGRTTGANAMDVRKGAVPATLLDGRAPSGRDEILLGTKLAGALHVEVGDTVAAGTGARKERLRVVGLGVVPASKWGKLGEGAALPFATLHRLQPSVVANAAELVFAPGRRAATLARLREFADGPSTAITPPDVAEFGGVRRLPLLIAATFGLAAAAALAHALLTSVRRRRRDLAVLKTLGFTRGQVIEAIAWQATTIAAVGLFVGLPLGVAVGRFAWHLFATDLGVVPEAVTALGPTALIVPAAALLANLVAALPATAAARTQPAAVLRAE
jgi:hypothetical protein